MKKLLSILFSTLFLLSACDSQSSIDTSDDKIDILCTLFPQYDWVSEIIKNNDNSAQAELLIDNGTDMHSFQPSADDIIKLASADVVIYVGGASDKWIQDTLKETPSVKGINMLEIIGDSALCEDCEENEHHNHASESDEHVWLSLRNAEKICKTIADCLSEADSANNELYQTNADEYIQQLQNLDERYSQTVETSKYKSLVFADRFPFRYLTNDYNLTYNAAFPGCSAESEASFETVTNLANTLDSMLLPAVIIIDGSTTKLAETVIENTQSKHQKILTLDSLQAVNRQNIENDSVKYLSVMEKNLTVLSEALN